MIFRAAAVGELPQDQDVVPPAPGEDAQPPRPVAPPQQSNTGPQGGRVIQRRTVEPPAAQP